MNAKKLSDEELWVAIKNNELKAFNIIFERYWSAVYSTSYHYIKDAEVCAEITHDIFLNIWNKRQNLDILSIKAYLTSSARYHVYKREKRVKVIDLKYVENYIGIPESSTRNAAEEHLNCNELEIRINTYLEELPQRCKEIFLLSREEHLSNDEIANRLSISKRTVENQITNALKHLRVSLKHLGIMMIFFKL
ncbi:sigma-70 family RNA polymerase sigma factor [Pedobacter gandavensis]|uniref:sigma-70 family RNA polymerase sigma factor n=1 Tax=Pedobacter gandavensis TaxID=2679963 RepID=UPI00247974F0|nr:sigma-70 family RNA polymerase sigma factor [Pedobacter gandavensis]WGQ10973.1 sigma-70 family RNA polymerase sigma factor [Pedobacter gandavensis]